MKKLFAILMSVFLMSTCSDDAQIVGPPPEPEKVGCEAADLYNWDELNYSDILGPGETTWLSFEVDSLAYYSVRLNSSGFECNIYDKCNPDDLAVGDTLLRSFVSVAQEIIDIGPVNPGDYLLSMFNTRNRAEFNFTIIVDNIVPGCTDYTAENYNPDANYDVGICQYEVIKGCMNENACNYNSLAEEDDGSCVLAEENYNCDGVCQVELDCNDECGGTATIDICGICGGGVTDVSQCEVCPDDVIADCLGVCGGSAKLDECGICNGDGPQHSCWDESLVCSPSDCTLPPIYGCTDETATNYNPNATSNDGSCEYITCPDEWSVDCDGNCAPNNWLGDTYCDDGSYSITNPDTNETYPVNLNCEIFNNDEGDCEEVIEGCGEGFIEDCNGNCAPEGWLGDGTCDDGSYKHNDIEIFFNCAIFNNDNGDCDGLNRTSKQRVLPNGRILIAQ